MTFVKSTPAFTDVYESPDDSCSDTAALDLGGNAVPASTSANGTGTTTGTANGATNCPQYYDNIARIVCLFWFNDISLLEGCLSQQHKTNTGVSMLSQLSNPTDSFRQFVSSVIEYTQLLPVAVSVSLLYILRLKQLSPKAIVGNPNSEYRVFTVGLMMANKFLDDNTYTNKTWAQVTKLPLAEVSTMEIEFLSNLGYNLRIAPNEWNSWSRDLKRWLGVHKQFCESQKQQRKQYSPPPSFYSKFKWSGGTKQNQEYVEDVDTPSPSSITSLTPTYPSVSPQTPPMERKRQLDDGEQSQRKRMHYDTFPQGQNPGNAPPAQPYAQQFPPIQTQPTNNFPMSVPTLPLPQHHLPPPQVLPLPQGYHSTGHSPVGQSYNQLGQSQNMPLNGQQNLQPLAQPQLTNIPCIPHQHVSPGRHGHANMPHASHVSPTHHVSPGHVPQVHHVSPSHMPPTHMAPIPHGTVPGSVPGSVPLPNGMPNGMAMSVSPNVNGHPVYHPTAIPPPMPYLPLAPKSLTADKFLPHPPPNQQPLYYVLSKSRDKQPLEGHIQQQQYYGQGQQYQQVMPFGGSSPIGPAAGQRWFCPTEPSSPYDTGATYHYASPGKMRWR